MLNETSQRFLDELRACNGRGPSIQAKLEELLNEHSLRSRELLSARVLAGTLMDSDQEIFLGRLRAYAGLIVFEPNPAILSPAFFLGFLTLDAHGTRLHTVSQDPRCTLSISHGGRVLVNLEGKQRQYSLNDARWDELRPWINRWLFKRPPDP